MSEIDELNNEFNGLVNKLMETDNLFIGVDKWIAQYRNTLAQTRDDEVSYKSANNLLKEYVERQEEFMERKKCQ